MTIKDKITPVFNDCIRTLMERISPDEEEQMLPKEWIKGLFDIEMIMLKRG